jgi:hypothetical protein
MDTARARFELENDIQAVEADVLFKYDEAQQQAINQQKPWSRVRSPSLGLKFGALAPSFQA